MFNKQHKKLVAKINELENAMKYVRNNTVLHEISKKNGRIC